MRKLYELCGSPYKTWKPLPTGDHNSSVVEDGYFESIADFVGNLDEKREKAQAEKGNFWGEGRRLG